MITIPRHLSQRLKKTQIYPLACGLLASVLFSQAAHAGVLSPNCHDISELPPNASSQITLWSPQFLQTEQQKPFSCETMTKSGAVSHISVPRMQVFLPKVSNHKAMLVISGGGYIREELGKEGIPVAQWLAQQGFTAYNLVYRLPDEGWNNRQVLFEDGQRALRLIRQQAATQNLNQVGVMGFSAGGHLAGMLATDWQHNFYPPQDTTDRLSARPDFAALLYPVVSMQPPDNNTRAFKGILGKNPTLEQQKALSVETWVNAQTPPMFIAHAKNDWITPASKSILLDETLKKFNIKQQLTIFPTGGHGWGMGKPDTPTMAWRGLFLDWAKQLS